MANGEVIRNDRILSSYPRCFSLKGSLGKTEFRHRKVFTLVDVVWSVMPYTQTTFNTIYMIGHTNTVY